MPLVTLKYCCALRRTPRNNGEEDEKETVEGEELTVDFTTFIDWAYAYALKIFSVKEIRRDCCVSEGFYSSFLSCAREACDIYLMGRDLLVSDDEEDDIGTPRSMEWLESTLTVAYSVIGSDIDGSGDIVRSTERNIMLETEKWTIANDINDTPPQNPVKNDACRRSSKQTDVFVGKVGGHGPRRPRRPAQSRRQPHAKHSRVPKSLPQSSRHTALYG